MRSQFEYLGGAVPSPEELQEFRERYPTDDRAFEFLLGCPPETQAKVMASFDPRRKDKDYSRQLTSFINSMSRDSAGKGPFNLFQKRHREDSLDDLQEKLESFRSQYPMDDRAWDFLTTSSAEVCQRILREFSPRTEGDSDYSSLVTTLVKRARMDSAEGLVVLKPGAGAAGLQSATQKWRPVGPSQQQLTRFKEKFPMDERAWDYLSNTSGDVQRTVLDEFKPRRDDDVDYSAPVTAFIRSLENRAAAKGPTKSQLDEFRLSFPADDRAFEYLTSSSAEVQMEVMSSFSPFNLTETDYSRQLTYYVKKVRDVATGLGIPCTYGADSDASASRTSAGGVRAESSSQRHKTSRRSTLDAFRERYPMDERAFDFLQTLSADLQRVIISEFQPRREGDPDYSAPITSFIRSVRNRQEAPGAGPAGTQSYRSERGGGSGGDASAARSLLSGFRRRYPMDDRAFDFLQQASLEVQQDMLAEFRPRREGEADYSGAVTSFIRKLQERHADSYATHAGRGDSGRKWARSRSPKRSSSGKSGGKLDSLQAFRKRYPMDERAWDFLSSSPSSVQSLVLSDFSPRSEGDSDYSSLVTSFLRSIRGRRDR